MATTQVAITIDSETLHDFDEARGLVKRSTMIQELISNFLKSDCGLMVRSTTKGTHPKGHQGIR